MFQITCSLELSRVKDLKYSCPILVPFNCLVKLIVRYDLVSQCQKIY
jgi:hypothetical protein